MTAESVHAACDAIRAAAGAGVTVVAATKYVSLADMAILAEAGVDVVGENRAQDLERKHAAYGDELPLALHRPASIEQGQDRERAL